MIKLLAVIAALILMISVEMCKAEDFGAGRWFTVGKIPVYFGAWYWESTWKSDTYDDITINLYLPMGKNWYFSQQCDWYSEYCVSEIGRRF